MSDLIRTVDSVLSGRLSTEEAVRLLLQRNTRRRRSHAIQNDPPEKADVWDWKRNEFITESEYARRFPKKA